MFHRFAAGAALVLGLTAGTAAFAHHSFAMFDMRKQMVLNGTVKAFEWTNPHTWVQVQVRDADGKVSEWSIEGMSINQLAREGWTRKTLAPGDQVTMTINPLKDGGPGGSLVRVTLPGGKVMGRPEGPPPPGLGAPG